MIILFASYAPIGCQFIEAQQPISNPIESQHSTDTQGLIPNPIGDSHPMDVAGGVFSFILVVGFAFLIPVVFFFLFYFFLAWSGLKILKIKGITRTKIALYALAMFLATSFLQLIISSFLGNVAIPYFPQLINVIVFFSLTLVIFKYYFLLSGRNLWHLFLYTIVVNLVLSFLFLTFF